MILYLKGKYGFEEITKESKKYLTQYDSMRASFIMQYEPRLLGEYAALPKLKTECIFIRSQDFSILAEVLADREKEVREDIMCKTKRYKELLTTLAMRN